MLKYTPWNAFDVWLHHIYIYIYTWDVKKCAVKKNQRLKALISNKAKKSVKESAT